MSSHAGVESAVATPNKTVERRPFLPDARVLDAAWLDSYLLELLWRPTASTLSRGPSFPDGDEEDDGAGSSTRRSSLLSSWRGVMAALLRYCQTEDILLCLHLGTLLVTGTTPAAQILQLEWKATTTTRWRGGGNGSTSSSSNPPQSSPPNLGAYCLVRLLTRAYQRYCHDCLHPALVQMHHEHDHAMAARESERRVIPDERNHVSLERQAWVCRLMDKLVAWARVMVWFGSWTGLSHFQTPSLALWLSGNCLIPQSNTTTATTTTAPLPPHPLLHVNFAHRRWLWKEGALAAQVLLAGWPLAHQTWQPFWEYVMNWFRQQRARGMHFFRAPGTAATPNKTAVTTVACPLCGLNPIVQPVRTNCGHWFCYTCLYQQQLQQASPLRQLHCCQCRTRITRVVPI